MALRRIVLRLARNPGTEFAEGDDHRGYTVTAPLDDEGQLDEAGFRKAPEACTVRRFAPDEAPEEGRLARRGSNWFFDYEEGDADDEPIHRLGDHRFVLGEYITVTDDEGRALTYKITEIQDV